MAEVDAAGNVNVSRFGSTFAGCGGFINISQNARKVVFLGTFSCRGLKVEIGGGRLRVVEDGQQRKFVRAVEQITFSGAAGPGLGHETLYVTERAVFRLTPAGMELTEIAPGVDLQLDVLESDGLSAAAGTSPDDDGCPAVPATSRWGFTFARRGPHERGSSHPRRGRRRRVRASGQRPRRLSRRREAPRPRRPAARRRRPGPARPRPGRGVARPRPPPGAHRRGGGAVRQRLAGGHRQPRCPGRWEAAPRGRWRSRRRTSASPSPPGSRTPTSTG